MATFQTTPNNIGITAATSLGTLASTTFDIDLSAKLGAWITVVNTGGGSVDPSSVLMIAPSVSVDGTTYSSSPLYILQVNTVASTAEPYTFHIDGGIKYRITLTNTDATNSITVGATYLTVDSIQ